MKKIKHDRSRALYVCYGITFSFSGQATFPFDDLQV